MRQYLRISRTVCRIPTCVVIFLVAFSCVICSGQQEADDPHSFTTLLQVLEGDNVRERRAAEQDDALEGSGPVTPDEDAPVIVVSEEKKFVVKKVGKLSVDVGSTVWAVRGTEISVSCRARSPSGLSTEIEWLRSYGVPVTERFRGGVAAREGTLTIRQLGRFNEGTYTCRASNKAGYSTALFTAKIIIASLPTILKVEGDFLFGPNDKEAEITIGSDVTVYPGTKLTIRCPVEGTGSIVVLWTSQGRPVNIGNAQRVGNDLVITNIDKRYALEYECTARAARGRVSEKSTVQVKDLNPPRIKHGSRDLRFIEQELPEVEIYIGSKLTVISETQIIVRCVAAMDPAPAVSWKIQGKDSGFKDGVILSKDNSSLTISDPGVEDSGVYTCTASNNVGLDSESSIINILPPEPPRIKYSNRKITSLENLDVVEANIGDELTLLAGANVVITCPTSGLPTPTVKWLKDGEDLSVNGSILTIKNAKTEDSGTFTCEAVNRAGRLSYNSEFRVIAGEKPRIETSTGRVIGLEGIEEAVVKIGQDLRVVEGLIVRLVCPVRGFPTPEVSWVLNERIVKTSGRFLVDTRSNSLIVDGIQLQDTGQVSCTASNSAGSAKAFSFISIIGESSAQIQSGNSSIESIEGITKVAIEIGDSLHVLSGSDVSIDCVARGTPRPLINWRWNGRDVISGSRRGQYAITGIPDGSRLTIWQMLSENAGQYECVAINTGGADRRASAITILDATLPQIEISTSSVEHIQNLNPVSVIIGTRVSMLPGGRLEITCRASGIPEPSISWLRQNKQIASSGRFSIVNTALIIHPIELDDRGSFTCAANNTLGRQTHSTTVDIVEPIKPRITKTGRDMKVELLVRLSEVVGGNILCRDGIDLELTCPVRGLPTPKITWLRGDKKVGAGGRLKLGILKEESSGNYSCVATNIAGEARKTTKLNVKSSIPPVIQSSTEKLESYEEDLYLAVEIGTRLEVIQGAKIDLICRITGFPTPNVNWVKGNSPLTVSFERQGFYIVPYNGTSTTLQIRGSQPPQEDEVYGCTAYNSGGSVTAFSYVTFKERVAPKVLSTWITGSVGVQESLETRDPVKVILGDTARMFTKTKVTIVCEVKAIPVAKVTWTKNGGPIDAKHYVNGTNLVLSEQSGISDSGRYACTARNPLGKDSASSDITFIEPILPTIITGESSVSLLSATNYRATIGTNITTVIGNNITFVCVAEGLPRPGVSWWKGDLDLDVNETSHIVYASDTDATGVYSCVASNLGGFFTTSSTVTVLDRIAPEKATRPRIITTRENQESFGERRTVEHTVGGNVTILEGRNLLLRCPVEGVPAPTTRWLFDGIPVQVSDTLQIDDDTGDLKIIEMTQDDVGEYSCVATNIAGETVEASYTTVIVPTFPNIDSSNISVQVFDPTRQPVSVKIGSHVITLTGTPVTITCDATGFPEPKVRWMKGFISITGSDAERLIVSESRLSLLSSGVSDSDQYMCTASSPGGQAAAVSNITFVESVKPRILFSTKAQEILQRLSINITIGEKLTILDKSNITVECSAEGVPPPSLSWSKDGVKLNSLQSNLLHLRNIARKDTGRYTCTAENFLGFVSQSTLLSVRAGRKPLINSKSQGVVVDDKITGIKLDVGSNLTLVAGSSVTITCEVNAVPEPTITWLQNEDKLLNNVNKTSLTVDNPSRVNLQTVSCTAANILGSDSKSSYFTILEPSKPRINIHEVPKAIEAQNRNPITLNIGDELTALTKTNVTIECPTSGVPRPTITWTKDGRILRDDGRYTIQVDGSLVIDEAKVQDSARYTCNADSINGQDSASSTVQIVEPVKPVIEVPKYGQDIPLDDVDAVTMNVGDNVTTASNTAITIRCPVSGVPTPSVTWQKDGVQIIVGNKFSMTDENSLVINDAEIKHSAKYSCIAQNEFGKDEASSTARIIELSKPMIDIPDQPHTIEAQDRSPVTLTIGENVTALTRTIITIQCNASGVPTPTVTWKQDDLRIPSDDRYIVEDDGSLLIAGSREGDSAKYTCTATSVAGEDSASSTVQIVEPLKPEIKVPETGQEIPVGDGSPVTMNIGDNVTAASNTTITIRCPVSGVPSPVVTWNKDDVPFGDGGRINVAENNTLVIKQVELDDSAKYTCSVQNTFGEDEASSIVRIIEPFKPVINIPETPKTIEAQDLSPIDLFIGDNVTALTNTSITIQCPTSGVPTPTVTWTKDNQEITNDGRYTVQDDGSLLISETDIEDSARHTCTAESVTGEDSASSTVQIIEPTKPMINVAEYKQEISIGDGSPVTMNVGDNVTAASNTTITIRCPVSGVPTPSAIWQKDGVEIGEGDKLTILDDNTLVIREADLEDDAKYTCTIQNAFGKDEVSSIVRIIEPSKPVIKIPEKPTMIEAQDRSPISLSIGDDVTALTNTSITIQCPTSGVPTPTVTWTKDGEQVPGDGRYTVQDDDSLLISEAVEDDSAQYTCIAESIIGKDSASSKLQIVEPVKPVIEVPKPGRDIPVGDGSPVTMNIGDNVTAASNTSITIRCPVSGVPTPVVTWEKDGAPVVGSGRVGEDNSLVLTGTQDNAKYTCRVSSVAGEDSLSSMINLIGPYKPKVNILGKPNTIEAQNRSPINMTIGDNVTALTDTSITIRCPTSGVPTPTVTWTKDGRDIPDGGKYTIQGDNSLMITKVDVEDGARYTCIADSVAGQDSASTEVQIVEPSKPTIEVGEESRRDIPVGDGSPVTMNIGDNVTAASNTTITIRCPTSGVPTPAVTWLKDGVQIIEGDRFSVTVDNSLVIKGAEAKESANYSCSVNSAFGKDDSFSIVRIIEQYKPSINISGAPRTIEAKDRSPITLIIGDNVTALTNTSITIQCPISGVPTPTITWTKDGQSIDSGGMYIVQDDGSLLINEAFEEDTALYTCTADSVAGKNSASSTVQIFKPTKANIEVPETGREIPIGDGSPVTMNIGDNVTAASNTTIIIRCPVSGIPTPVVIWEKDGVLLIQEDNISVREDSLLIRGAEVEDSAKYTCRVGNVAGLDEQSSIIKIIGPSKPKFDISAIPKAIQAQDRSPVTLTIGDNITALTNTSITIQCPTSGVPTPTVIWTKNGLEIFDGGRYAVLDDGSLLIRGTHKKDSGQFTCTAANVAGKDKASSTVQVFEPTKPIIEVPDTKRDIPVGDGSPVIMNIGDNVTAASNTSITIRCPVSGVPKPSVSWKMDDVQITEGDRFSITDDSTLIIKRPGVEVSAKYTCSVENKFGKDYISSHVKILEPSQPVVNVYGTPKTIDAQDRSPITMAIADNVTALTNTSITIQCPISGVPTPAVTWAKDGQEIPKDGRYTVQGDSSLLIKEALEEDTARYTCTADSVTGKDSASSTVQIVDPIKPVIEVLKPGKEIPVGDGSPVIMNIGDNVTAASNTTITIRCPVSGVPTPAVSWQKDGARVTQGETLLFTTDSSLVIKNGDVNDSAKYTCSIQSNFGKEDISSVVEIIAHKKPVVKVADPPKTIEAQDRSPITLSIGDNVTALTNTSITIQCFASGVPTPTVTWTKDGEQIPKDSRYTVQDDGSLLVNEAGEEDRARYTCTTGNVVGKGSASSTVNIVDPIKPMIKLSEPAQEIPLGDGSPVTMNIGDNVTATSNTTITIRCPVSGVPTPAVTWQKNGVPVIAGGNIFLINGKQQLIVRVAKGEDSGKYSCSVENNFGKDSLSSIVKIMGPSKPKVKIPEKPRTIEAQDQSPITLIIADNVTALVNTSITIQCPNSGVPPPTVTWTKDGEQIANDGRYTIQDDGSLLISEAAEEDSARYTCTADSVAGKDSASSTVQIVDPIKPAIDVRKIGQKMPVGDGSPVTLNVGDNVTAASNTTITIRCPVSGVPTPSVTWHKDGTQIFEQDGVIFKADNNSLVIELAMVVDSAKYTCRVQSVFGMDEVSSQVTITDPVRPRIASSLGNVTSFSQDPVNITIGQNLLTIIDTKLSIYCEASGVPVPKIAWSRGNVSLPSDGRMSVKNGTLVIVEVETSDSGNYTCTAENTVGRASLSSNVTIAVPTPPEIIRRGIEDVQVLKPKSIEAVVGSTVLTMSGNNVSIYCGVRGFPTPSVEWTKDDVLLEAEGSILSLSSVDSDDSGSYTCTATSPVGSSDSQSTNLTVIAIQLPKIITYKDDVEVLEIENISVPIGGVVTTLVGNRVSMVCEVGGIPAPQITWERDGVELQRGGKFYTIDSARQDDNGNYSCSARNSAGEVKASSQLKILAGSAPNINASHDSRVHLRIDFFAVTIGTNLTTLASSGLEITCPVTGFPKPSIHWYREGVPVEPGMMLNVDEDTGTLFTLSISHRKGGEFTCKASNALGSDSASSFVTVLVPGAPQINVSRVAVRSLDNREPVSIRIGQALSVLSGTKVSIECHVSGVPKPEVTWSRQGSNMNTDGRELVKDSVLIITNATKADTGVYLCKAVNLAGEVVASSMVNVTKTSSPVISTADQSLQILQSGSFTVDVGSIVTTVARNALSIRCNATGVPTPQIYWSKDGRSLDSRGSLHMISSLVLSDSGRYQCTASNIDGADNQDIRINVLDGSAPRITGLKINVAAVSGEKEVKIVVGGNVTTVIGTSVEIHCPVTALPNATVTWLFNGSTVKTGNRRLLKLKNSALTLSGVTSEDIGSYTCLANNSYGKDTRTTFLSLIVPVEPKILSSNENFKDFKSVRHELIIGDNLETLEGTTVYVRCPATGNPAPKVTWKKSGSLVPRSLRIVNNTLVLLNVTWSGSGTYSCTASNGAGADVKSTYLNFIAPEKPLIRGDPTDVEWYNGQPITVAVGGTLKVLMKTTVNFRCVASGIPEPSVFWNSSSNDMQPANKFDVNQEGVLTIHEVDTRDSGKYTCSAVNKAGEDTSAAVLEVVEPTLPTIVSSEATLSWYNRESRTLPVGGTVEVLSGTEVTLTCKYSAFPEADVKWTVLDEEGDPLPDAGYKIVNGSLVLMALQPSDSAQYVCSVTNVAGTTSASTKLKVVDPQPPLISSFQDNVVSLSDRTPVEVSAGSVVTVLSGTRITVTCSAVGTPTPSVAWSRGEELIHTSSAGNMTAAHTGILTIDDASTNDTGDYLCTAMSEVGVDQESTKITVIEPSKPIIRQPEVDKIPLTNDTLVQMSVGSDVTVLTQTRVNVTCEVSGVPKPTITWLKDDKQVESEENDYLVLIIRNVEDAGQVTCRAKNLAGNASLSTNIDVTEPVVPRITSDTGTIDALDKRQAVSGSVGMTVQTFTGTSLNLKCQTEGSPKPVISWTKNGQRLESKGRVSISGDGTLTIKNTRAQDTGRFKCSAKNAIGETSAASSVYIRTPMSPKIRKSKAYIIWYEKRPFKGKIGDNLTTLKGRKLTLTCPAVGLPKPTITWYRSGMRMKSGKNYLVIGQTLIMYNLDPMDTDRYTCVARNFAGVRTATTTLKVHEPMAPDIMATYGSEESLQDRRHFNVTIGKDISILRGSPLTLKCPVVGVPEPKITWIKDRKMLSSNDRMNTDCIGTLDIYKVELEDSGDYACSAQSFLGMDIAFSSLTVYEAVKPTVEISGRVYVSGGDLVDMHVGDNLTALLTTPVKINCTARGIPKPKMSWKMNGQQLGNGGNYKTDNNGALAIKGVKDPGEFKCIAENFVGQDDASSFISLLDPERPVVIPSEKTTTIEAKDRSPITLIIGDNLTALTNTSITIQCPTSGVPTPTVTWTKNGEELPSDGRYNVEDDGSLLIIEVVEEDSARYTCIADSVTGRDSASSTVKIAKPIKPVIEVPKPGQKIPVGDGSPVTMNVGDSVTAVSNTTITIRCPVRGIPTPDVTWEKDGRQVTPGGRFSIISDYTLVIKEAAVDDSAEYRCSVKSVAGTDSESSTVEIIKPSKPLIKISDKPKTVEAKDRSPITMTIADNVTALANTSITIQCPISGVPTPTVIWTKDNQEITNDGRYTVQDDGSLLISEADVEDSAQYTCTADNVAGKNSASSMVKIEGLEKPSILVQTPGPKVPIGDGSPVVTPVGSQITEIAFVTVSLTCPTKGSPPPKITWKKDGEELASGDRFVIDNDGTLTIPQAVLKDTGNYTCSAQNEAGVEEVTSSIGILEPLEPIILPPQGSIISDDHKRVTAGVGSKIDALKGAAITITCEVKGVPKPKVSWTKDGQNISPDERVVLGSNGTLIIRDSTLDDSGNYTCTARSRTGQSSSTSPVAVLVPSKPSIERSEKEVSWGKESLLSVAIGSRVEIINGSSVTLVCNSSGFPPPKLTWTRGIETLPNDGNYEIGEQTLTISDVQYTDADEFTCTAANQAGQDAATTELVVKGPGRPVISSHKINITDVDSSKPVVVPIGANVTTIVNATVVITCPTKGSPQPIVTWKHDRRFIVAGARYQVNDTALIIREVRLDDAGRYECTASNRFGRDVQSLSLDITVPPLISNVRGSFEITDIRDLVSITTGAVVTIPRGVAVRIKCIATGVPSPNITWYRKGQNAKEKSLLVPNDNMKIIKDYSLQIAHTLVVDAAYYTCVATNIAGQDEGTTHLNIGTPPEIPNYWRGVKSRFGDQARDLRKSSGAVATVVKGANLNIKCAVVGNPKPTIKWTVATTGRQRRYTVLNDGTLEVPNADLEDEGNYTCIANNSYGILKRTTSVSILVPPEILERHFRHLYDEKRIAGYAMAQMEVKRRTISSLTIEEGYNLILICTVSGKPKPRVTWSRNRVVIKNDTRHLLLPNGVLLVRHVLVKESGQYKCVATNVAGEDQGIVQLTVKDQAKGYWKVTGWSKCENCVTHLRGWQERHISCIGPGGVVVSDLHCIHKPKPIKRQRCIHRDCHVIWSASVWSACSRSCGLHGIKLRNVKCVFAKSLKPAKGQCGWQEKPALQEPCNRKSCTKANCVDRVKYCYKVKKIGMCAVYSRWCCNTCHTA